MGAQAVVVSGGRYGDAQQILIFVHSLHHGGQEEQKLHVFVWTLAGIQQVLTSVRGEGPVVVLAAAVDPVKWFFVKQADQPVAGGYIFMVSMVSWLWSVAMLVVAKMGASSCCAGAASLCFVLARMPSFQSSSSNSFIKGRNPGFDGAEVMVFQLLPLRRFDAEQGAAAENKVFPLLVKLTVDEKVFLFRAHGGNHTIGPVISQNPQNPQRLNVQTSMERSRESFVQHLAAVGTIGGGNIEESPFTSIRVGSQAVTPGLQRWRQAAGGKEEAQVHP